jgi:hypothetical protein
VKIVGPSMDNLNIDEPSSITFKPTRTNQKRLRPSPTNLEKSQKPFKTTTYLRNQIYYIPIITTKKIPSFSSHPAVRFFFSYKNPVAISAGKFA